MSDFPVFSRHIGTWEGTYTLFDRAGQVLDQHESRLSITHDGETYQQRNEYRWADGKTEIKDFGGTFRDGKLLFDTPRLKGEAVEVDDATIILRWVYTHEPDNGYSEIITLIDDEHRARTWQHFEAGEFAKLTVIDERKVA